MLNILGFNISSSFYETSRLKRNNYIHSQVCSDQSWMFINTFNEEGNSTDYQEVVECRLESNKAGSN